MNNEQILALLGYNAKDFYTDKEDKTWIFSKKEHLCYEDYNKKIYGPDIRINYTYDYYEEYKEHIYFVEITNNNIVSNKTIRVLSDRERYEELKNSKFYQNNIIVFKKL